MNTSSSETTPQKQYHEIKKKELSEQEEGREKKADVTVELTKLIVT
jgi:hypothetical protein